MSDLAEITRCYSLRYERRSRHSPARLWRAITDAREVTRWMSYPARIDLRVGGEYFVDFTGASDENLDGVNVRVEPERRLAYAWGVSVVEWTLEPDGDGCRYAFVHHGMKKRDIPDEHGVAVGWHLWLDALERHLAGRPIDTGADPERHAMSRAYRERLAVVLG